MLDYESHCRGMPILSIENPHSVLDTRILAPGLETPADPSEA